MGLLIPLLIGLGLAFHARQRLRSQPLEVRTSATWTILIFSTIGACLVGMIGSIQREESGIWSAMWFPRIYAKAGLGALGGLWIGVVINSFMRPTVVRTPNRVQLPLRGLFLILVAAGPAGWLIWNWPESFAMIAAQQASLGFALFVMQSRSEENANSGGTSDERLGV